MLFTGHATDCKVPSCLNKLMTTRRNNSPRDLTQTNPGGVLRIGDHTDYRTIETIVDWREGRASIYQLVIESAATIT
jgi:hypothetical protein